ncbi:hypothetical protein [Polaribacter sp. R77954]|uniref:hypothetical protein n=1 Tax=Polaribacter sp. R77954 TaxID=3093870 RepID=UPI0037C57633
MAKLTSILLAHLILLQSLNVNLDSFSKLTVLLEHAKFHQEKYGDTFFEFLSEHYGSNEFKATKHKEHKDLPFKQNAQNYNQLPTVFALNTSLFALKPNIVIQIQQNYYYKESHSLFEKPSVFQPPQLS